MKFSFALISALFCTLTLAQTAPRLSHVGAHPVVFQGREVTFVAAHELYKTRVVARWDAQTFEVADAYFKCTARRCAWEKTISRAFYSSCTQKGASFSCRGKIALGTTDLPSTPSQSSSDMRTWGEDESSRENTTHWDGEEPQRNGNWETDGIILF